MTYADLIKDTFQYYTAHPRSSLDESSCLYLGKNGERCAVSRCCKDDEHINAFLASFDSNLSSSPAGVSTVFQRAKLAGLQILRDEYAHLDDKGFWEALQLFHDTTAYWDKESPEAQTRKLTSMGVDVYEDLMKAYGNV